MIKQRVWVELNRRVSYPIKRAVSSMVTRNMVDLDSEVVKFCVSLVLIPLCKIGRKRFISVWNCHDLPSRGIPNLLKSQCNGTTVIILMKSHQLNKLRMITDSKVVPFQILNHLVMQYYVIKEV